MSDTNSPLDNFRDLDPQTYTIAMLQQIHSDVRHLTRQVNKIDVDVRRLDTDLSVIKGENKWSDKIIWLPVALGSSFVGAIVVGVVMLFFKK